MNKNYPVLIAVTAPLKISPKSRFFPILDFGFGILDWVAFLAEAAMSNIRYHAGTE